jgi:hypothetical protein
MTTNTRDLPQGLPVEDIDLVATWLDADKVRFAAGIAAGLFAGLVALGSPSS